MDMKNWDSIILFDSSCNINDLTSDKIENSLIITFDYNSHKNLEKSHKNLNKKPQNSNKT